MSDTTYQFLPWVRFGSAARLAEPDQRLASQPARGSFQAQYEVTGTGDPRVLIEKYEDEHVPELS